MNPMSRAIPKMPDSHIGNLSPELTVHTVIMSGIVAHATKTRIVAEHANLLVADIMRELFKPEWAWAIKATMAQRASPVEPIGFQAAARGMLDAIADTISKQLARSGIELTGNRPTEFAMEFLRTIFHPAYMQAILMVIEGMRHGLTPQWKDGDDNIERPQEEV